MAYCEESDLLLEELPNQTVIVAQKYIDSAADEIDVILGSVYETPISVVDVPANRRTTLFLKQCNAQIASGRIIIALTLTREADNLHAAARQMINGALAALNQLVGGSGYLPGAILSGTSDATLNRVAIHNRDATSSVEDYEDVVMAGQFTAKKPKYVPYSVAVGSYYPGGGYLGGR